MRLDLRHNSMEHHDMGRLDEEKRQTYESFDKGVSDPEFERSHRTHGCLI